MLPLIIYIFLIIHIRIVSKEGNIGSCIRYCEGLTESSIGSRITDDHMTLCTRYSIHSEDQGHTLYCQMEVEFFPYGHGSTNEIVRIFTYIHCLVIIAKENLDTVPLIRPLIGFSSRPSGNFLSITKSVKEV